MLHCFSYIILYSLKLKGKEDGMESDVRKKGELERNWKTFIRFSLRRNVRCRKIPPSINVSLYVTCDYYCKS